MANMNVIALIVLIIVCCVCKMWAISAETIPVNNAYYHKIDEHSINFVINKCYQPYGSCNGCAKLSKGLQGTDRKKNCSTLLSVKNCLTKCANIKCNLMQIMINKINGELIDCSEILNQMHKEGINWDGNTNIWYILVLIIVIVSAFIVITVGVMLVRYWQTRITLL